jgi:hypothetical protein
MFIKNLYKSIVRILKSIPEEIFIFLVSFIYRLPTLGYDFINNDAFLWKERGYAFGSALTSLNFAATAVTYHPGVPLLWSQFIAIKVYSSLLKLGVLAKVDSHDEFLVNNQIQAMVVVFLTSVLITIAYHKLKKIIGMKLSLLAVLLVALEPFYLGLARTIHTDVIISLFMFISVLYFYSSVKDENKKLVTFDVIIAGVFAGLAFLTKSSALFLIPFFILISSVIFYKTKNSALISKTLIIFGFAILTFFVVWPAMWVQPIDSLNLYLFKGVQGIAIEEGHQHFWFGQLTDDPGPLFYPIVLIGRYSIILIAGFLGSIYLLYKNRSKAFTDKRIGFYFVSFLFSLFYIVMVTIVSKKLDRYSLPVIFSFAVLAAWFYSQVFRRKILMWLIVGLIIMRGLLFYGLHPNYLAYYSPLIGGVEDGRYIIEPKWLIGYDKVAEYFNEKQEGKNIPIKVAIADFDYLRPFAKFEVLNIKNDSERDHAEYLVLPAYRQERNNYYKGLYLLTSPDETIKVTGVDYYYIYKIKK